MSNASWPQVSDDDPTKLNKKDLSSDRRDQRLCPAPPGSYAALIKAGRNVGMGSNDETTDDDATTTTTDATEGYYYYYLYD